MAEASARCGRRGERLPSASKSQFSSSPLHPMQERVPGPGAPASERLFQAVPLLRGGAVLRGNLPRQEHQARDVLGARHAQGAAKRKWPARRRRGRIGARAGRIGRFASTSQLRAKRSNPAHDLRRLDCLVAEPVIARAFARPVGSSQMTGVCFHGAFSRNGLTMARLPMVRPCRMSSVNSLSQLASIAAMPIGTIIATRRIAWCRGRISVRRGGSGRIHSPFVGLVPVEFVISRKRPVERSHSLECAAAAQRAL